MAFCDQTVEPPSEGGVPLIWEYVIPVSLEPSPMNLPVLLNCILPFTNNFALFSPEGALGIVVCPIATPLLGALK